MVEAENNLSELTDLVLPFSAVSSGSPSPAITCEEIKILGGSRALLLRNVLTKEESQFYIQQAEALGLTPVGRYGYKTSYRNNDRVVATSVDLSRLLFDRIKPFLQQEVVIDDSNASQHHLGTKGVWRLFSVNECFRLCRYQPGGHFSPHYDGEFVRKPGERSLKTVMLYLNEDFEGGTTNFLDDNQELTRDEATNRYIALESSIICKVKPEAGMAIVFDHKILHEGAEVLGGQKYILRTDAMYELVGRLMTEDEEKFHLLIQQAQKLEDYGQPGEAMKIYQQLGRKYPELAAQWGI